jgi:hypothetical protein
VVDIWPKKNQADSDLFGLLGRDGFRGNFLDWRWRKDIMKNLCEHEDSPLKDGMCTLCAKPAPWHRLNFTSREPIAERSKSKNQFSILKESNIQDSNSIDNNLREASNRVIKISTVFGTMGSVLNVLNHGLAVLLLSVTFALSSSAENGGLALLAGIGITVLIWGIGWIQVALLRGLSAFFLMRGLAHLKSVSDS